MDESDEDDDRLMIKIQSAARREVELAQVTRSLRGTWTTLATFSLIAVVFLSYGFLIQKPHIRVEEEKKGVDANGKDAPRRVRTISTNLMLVFAISITALYGLLAWGTHRRWPGAIQLGMVCASLAIFLVAAPIILGFLKGGIPIRPILAAIFHGYTIYESKRWFAVKRELDYLLLEIRHSEAG